MHINGNVTLTNDNEENEQCLRVQSAQIHIHIGACLCVSVCASPCPHLHLIAVTPSDKLETSEQPKYSSGDKMYAAGDNTVWKRCGAEVAPKAHRSQSQATGGGPLETRDGDERAFLCEGLAADELRV